MTSNNIGSAADAWHGTGPMGAGDPESNVQAAAHDTGDGDAERRLALMRAETLAGKSPEAVALLHELVEALATYPEKDGDNPRFSLNALNEDGQELVRQVLGEGEVSIIASLSAGEDGQNVRGFLNIQEAVTPGLWRIMETDSDGGITADWIEVADIPAMVRTLSWQHSSLTGEIGDAPGGAMNIMPVLAELRERMLAREAEGWTVGQENHVINLSLLPMNEADLACLADHLGYSGVRILSRGYGVCKIASTCWRHVWTVRFMNAMDNVVLDTIEIGDVPLAARAHAEDFPDSAQRLKDVLEAYL